MVPYPPELRSWKNRPVRFSGFEPWPLGQSGTPPPELLPGRRLAGLANPEHASPGIRLQLVPLGPPQPYDLCRRDLNRPSEVCLPLHDPAPGSLQLHDSATIGGV